MKEFNKYDFKEDLSEAISEFLTDSDFKDEDIDDEVYDFICQHVDNQVIYYSECWNICREFQVNDFEIESTGEYATNISELAYHTLFDYAMENLGNLIELNK